MFIVHYENGKSVSESEMNWIDVSKENITSVQLKWDTYDFVKVLRDRVDQFALMIDSGQQFKATLEKEIEDYVVDIGVSNSSRKHIANSVLEKANGIISIVESKLKTDKAECLKLADLKRSFGLSEEDNKRFEYLANMVRRAEVNKTLLMNIIGDMRAFLDSDIKMATISGSSKYKYAFWQDKVAYYNLDSEKNLGPFAQRIGMVIDSTGKTIVCEMNLRTGSYKIYLTTVDSLKLNLDLFKINLSEVG